MLKAPVGQGLSLDLHLSGPQEGSGLPLHCHTGPRGLGPLDWAARSLPMSTLSRQGLGRKRPSVPAQPRHCKSKTQTGNNFLWSPPQSSRPPKTVVYKQGPGYTLRQEGKSLWHIPACGCVCPPGHAPRKAPVSPRPASPFLSLRTVLGAERLWALQMRLRALGGLGEVAFSLPLQGHPSSGCR